MNTGKSKRGEKNAKKFAIEEAMSKKEPSEQIKEEDDDFPAANELRMEVKEELLHKMSIITKDLRSFKKDIQEAVLGIKVEMGKNLKEELAEFKHELNQKIIEHAATLQRQGNAISEAEECIFEVEASGAITKEALLSLLKEQRRLQEKVIDLESRSRRNNIRIYGVPENSEGESTIDFVENLLSKEVLLPEGMSLQIQRAHRASAQKPGPGATLRSIILNFLQFDIKEIVLKLAWKRKILLNNKQIYFDNDYAYEVMEKRKTYGEIKKALREMGIRFQTTFTWIRIHWSNGPLTYGETEDAAKELRAQGIVVTTARTNLDVSMEEKICNTFPWQELEAEATASHMETRVRHKQT